MKNITFNPEQLADMISLSIRIDKIDNALDGIIDSLDRMNDKLNQTHE